MELKLKRFSKIGDHMKEISEEVYFEDLAPTKEKVSEKVKRVIGNKTRKVGVTYRKLPTKGKVAVIAIPTALAGTTAGLAIKRNKNKK